MLLSCYLPLSTFLLPVILYLLNLFLGIHGWVVAVIDFVSLAPHCCPGYESPPGTLDSFMWCSYSQMPYGILVFVLSCALVPEVMWFKTKQNINLQYLELFPLNRPASDWGYNLFFCWILHVQCNSFKCDMFNKNFNTNCIWFI